MTIANKFSKRSIVSLILFLYFASATLFADTVPTKEPLKPIERERVFDVSFDRLWNLIVEMLVYNDDFILKAHKKSGVIEARRILPYKQLPAHAGFSLLSFESIMVTGSHSKFRVAKVSDHKTKVQIDSAILGYHKAILFGRTEYEPKAYQSNGALEKQYLDLIESEIKKGRDAS